MKLSQILLFAGVLVSLNANANTSNATCAHGDKNALVKNKVSDVGQVNMILGTGAQTQSQRPSSNTKGTR
ncbi:MAG: hypothetical protein HC883_03985 [Bdellovibrionaceae bacterium]|nr:hypothetical protein [Pseudobdellovibrionaceae bacterium]